MPRDVQRKHRGILARRCTPRSGVRPALRAILLSVMRRTLAFILSLALSAFVLGEGVGFAVSEGDIQSAVNGAQSSVNADINDAASFTCGGLLNVADPRVAEYYAKRPVLECGPESLMEWCTEYGKPGGGAAGKCIGKKCKYVKEKGVQDRTLLLQCDPSGNCVTPPGPHQSCENAGLSYFQSQLRHYSCTLRPFAGSPTVSGTAEADCYTYLPNLRYAESYYPFAYNCSVTYSSSPVDAANPKGQLSLIPPLDVRPVARRSEDAWEPVPGSNAATASMPASHASKDSSSGPLHLEMAAIPGQPGFLHPTVEAPGRLTSYPDLSTYIGRLLEPPEVRLVLPTGGLSLSTIGQDFFAEIYESLRGPQNTPPVTLSLGDNPDALLLGIDYLRNVPLIEVRYIPVDISAPFVGETRLKQLIEEWRTWLAEIQKLDAADPSATLDSSVVATVKANIEALQSYFALEDSIREYRLHFPSYLNAVLSYVQQANDFFAKWMTENATRLKDWHDTYTAYLTVLPGLRKKLQTLSADAAKYTAECLVPACRLDVVPVKKHTKPWDLVPENSDLVFGGSARALLPASPHPWENYEDEVTQWHPPALIGAPLPDLTLDFSALSLRQTINIPVLEVELSPLDLPSPSSIDPANLASEFALLKQTLTPLPHFHPPLAHLTFPTLHLPDPATSLFFIPEAPQVALTTLDEAIKWMEKRLSALDKTCDRSNVAPETFLVHEFQLYGSRRDPAALRATAFVPWPRGSPLIPLPWFYNGFWYAYPYGYGISTGGFHLPPLLTPPPCSSCGTVRPQRFIRQHVELDTEWRALQDHFLRAIDDWNAQVRYFSVVPRNELEDVHAYHPSLLPLLLPPRR